MTSASNQKPKDLFLLEGISLVAFNKDFTQVALSKKDNNIYIYSVPDIMKTDKWKLLYTLESHYQYISGLDWCPKTNRILSCSYDKTSFVWDFADNKWTPSNVVATTKLGYLCCKWNKRGDKFCEGTSSKQLFIGYFNKKFNWWMGINIKVHKSSVVSCEIDPTSLYVISGSTDLRVYVSSCYLPEIDDEFLNDQTRPLAQDFGTPIFEIKPNCWINSVAWLPSGDLGVVAGQDATISVIDYKEKKSDVIRCKHSPATQIIPISDNSFFAVCYDRNIIEYEKKGDNWEIKKTITDKGEADKKGKTTVGGSVSAALEKFQKMGNIKKENLAVTTKQNSHLHQSLISSVNIKGKDMITTDVSGFVKYWKL
jgi:actin related protein 2/3 complex subunit 1A/1B